MPGTKLSETIREYETTRYVWYKGTDTFATTAYDIYVDTMSGYVRHVVQLGKSNLQIFRYVRI